ncbi:MAG TPA: hypothetical protein PKD68_01290 [Candidatus Saccharibacteria bacterium]|nr:hypothetical protein [Candidatus Saccharibacteria bacterium]
MARLPIPGQDAGKWGDILNEYLSQSHNADGSLKPITEPQLAPAVQAKLNNHTTTISDVSELETVLAEKAAATHNHTIGDVMNLQTVLDSALPATAAWADSTASRHDLRGDYTGRYDTVGTGTDDRAAIQAMLDVASDPHGSYAWSEIRRRGVTVTLPAGVYLIGSREDGMPSLTIPEGVTADFSQAMMFFDYPDVATGSWSAILLKNAASLIVPSLMAPSGRNSAPGAPGTSNTSYLYDGVRILCNNNATTTVRAHTASEIKGFKGASIRGIGAWITRIDGPIKLSSQFGYIASALPADNVYGYSLTNIPGLMSGVRQHTDLYINGVYFNENAHGGLMGVVTGSSSNPHGLYFSNAGFQVYLTDVIFEYFAAAAIWVSGFCVSLIDCAFEECGAVGGWVVWFNNVRSVVIKNLRWNYAGASVPGASGSVTPFIQQLFRVNNVGSLIFGGGYIHNTYSGSCQLFGASASNWHVVAPVSDANAFAASPMYAPGGISVTGTWNHPMQLGSNFMWVDTTGALRIKTSIATSDTDGAVVGTQT